MVARVISPAKTLTILGFIILAALAAFLAFGPQTTQADSTFDPSYDTVYCNLLPDLWPGGSVATSDVDVSSDGTDCTTDGKTVEPGITSDYTTNYVLSSGDLNFSNITAFSPPGTTITSGTAIPVGTKVGGLRASTNLGFVNGGCNTALTIDFLLYNVALPDVPGDPRASSNIAFPRAEGSTGRFESWTVGSVDVTTAPTLNIADGGDALTGIADSTETAFNNYPSYLLDLFDPDFINNQPPTPDTDGPLKPIVPTAVYGGITNVLNEWTPLFFVQFAPGTLVPLGGAQGLMTAPMGPASVAVLVDPTAVVSSPSAITDFCTLLDTFTMLLGDLPGTAVDRMTTPATEGTGLAVQYAASLRDLDQDGFENALDTCPLAANAGDPRGLNNGANGDSDADGLDNVCDPGAVFGGGCDPDGAGPLPDIVDDNDSDCFQNHQDNCPIDTNGGPQGSVALNDQTEKENSIAGTGANADFGPQTDGMGDACDIPANGPVSVAQNKCAVVAGDCAAIGTNLSIALSDSIANGRWHISTAVSAVCIDAAGGADLDLDDDGYCTAQDSQETGACAAFTPDSCPVRHKAWADGSYGTNPALEMDVDGDGFSDALETYQGTDPTKACAQTATLSDESPLDNNPLDYNDSGNVTTADVGNFVAPLNKPVNGAGGGARFDLNHDGITTTADVGFFVAPLNKFCNPSAPAGAGSQGIPAFSQQ